MADKPAITEREIWTAANLVVKHHGEDAKLHAAGRADALLEKGDLEGKRVWMRILEKIGELEREGPENGEPVH